jgi:hypothetical protein
MLIKKGGGQELQDSKPPHKTKIPLLSQPDHEWMVCFFKHWEEATKNVNPKPQILFNGKQMLIISRSDFPIQHIIPAVRCMGKTNREQQLQINVDSEVAEAYKKGTTANPL